MVLHTQILAPPEGVWSRRSQTFGALLHAGGFVHSSISFGQNVKFFVKKLLGHLQIYCEMLTELLAKS